MQEESKWRFIVEVVTAAVHLVVGVTAALVMAIPAAALMGADMDAELTLALVVMAVFAVANLAVCIVFQLAGITTPAATCRRTKNETL